MIQKLKEMLKYILPFTLAVFIFALLTNFQETIGILSTIWNSFFYLLNRFLIGFGMAYMMNFFVEWLRKRFKFKKGPAIAFAYLFFIGIITVLIVFIVPMVIGSISEIFNAVKIVPQFPEDIARWLESTFPELGEESISYVRNLMAQGIGSASEMLQNLFTLANVSGFLSGFTRSFLNILFGMIISAYALIEKPALIRRSKSLVYALFSVRRAGHIISVTRESNRIFSSFLVGKIIDSLIIGIISLPIYYLFGIPQAPFMALIAGVTNIVPYFGPLVGGVISVLILLFFDPVKALYVLVIVIVVQTFDGYFLGPRILGNAVGISPLLTIVAITLGGDLFGFMGIFLGVPAMAVFKTMIFDRLIARRLMKKQAAHGDIPEHVLPPPDGPPKNVPAGFGHFLGVKDRGDGQKSFRVTRRKDKKNETDKTNAKDKTDMKE